MAIKVGINGFGRIGRVVFRVLMQRQDEFELCGINLRNAELDYMAYQLKYDSIFGRFDGDIEIGGELPDCKRSENPHLQRKRRFSDSVGRMWRGIHHRINRRIQYNGKGFSAQNRRCKEGYPDSSFQG